jgi:hypothetical protein
VSAGCLTVNEPGLSGHLDESPTIVSLYSARLLSSCGITSASISLM